MKKKIVVIILLTFLITVSYATPKMDIQYIDKNIVYKITSTDEYGKLTPSSGRITIKKDSKVVWSGTVYTFNGVYKGSYTIKGPGVYQVIYVEDGSNKIAKALVNISIKQPKNITPVEPLPSEENETKESVFSLRNPLCYGVAFILFIILIYVLYNGFKSTKKKKISF